MGFKREMQERCVTFHSH